MHRYWSNINASNEEMTSSSLSPYPYDPRAHEHAFYKDLDDWTSSTDSIVTMRSLQLSPGDAGGGRRRVQSETVHMRDRGGNSEEQRRKNSLPFKQYTGTIAKLGGEMIVESDTSGGSFPIYSESYRPWQNRVPSVMPRSRGGGGRAGGTGGYENQSPKPIGPVRKMGYVPDLRKRSDSDGSVASSEPSESALVPTQYCEYCFSYYARQCYASYRPLPHVADQGPWNQHMTKDVLGRITCPLLSIHVCVVCGGVGPNTHRDVSCPLSGVARSPVPLDQLTGSQGPIQNSVSTHPGSFVFH